MHEFGRIKRLPPYVFSIVNELKAKARAQGEDIIDFGMGNPDQPTPQHIVDKLCEAAQNPKNHRYSVNGRRSSVCERHMRSGTATPRSPKPLASTVRMAETSARRARLRD